MASDKKIVAIGGGTGLSILLRGIKTIFEDITAIVNVVDDGGSSGLLREDLGMLPPGDIRNCILALAETESKLKELFDYRFKDGRLAGQSFGNLMIAAMAGISDNFEEAVKNISSILAVKGKILPATIEDIKLTALLKDGTKVVGESIIPYYVLKRSTEIEQVYIVPEGACALDEVIKAIEEADYILIGPGSLYTSILPNLLVNGISESIVKARAKKIFIPNLMTQPGETDHFTIRKHVEVLDSHVGDLGLDYVIVNNKTMDEEIKNRYLKENSKQIELCEADRTYFAGLGIEILESDLVEVKYGYVRHDAPKIAEMLSSL